MFHAYVRSGSARVAATLCLLGLVAGCAGNTHEDDDDVEVTPEIEEPLTLAIDDLALRHGSLRISASMEDGSADVAMWLGGTCDPIEVGRGIATRSGFRWSLSTDEVGRAIECGLVVKAHGVNDERQRVVKVASLDVGVSLEADGAENVSVTTQTTNDAETTLTFGAPRHVSHIFVGGSVIGADDLDEDGETNGVYPSAFTVENRDLARAMLQRRQISVLGEYFLATVSVGGVTLDVATPVEPETETEVAEPEPVEPRYFHHRSRYVVDPMDDEEG